MQDVLPRAKTEQSWQGWEAAQLLKTHHQNPIRPSSGFRCIFNLPEKPAAAPRLLLPHASILASSSIPRLYQTLTYDSVPIPRFSRG